MQLDLLPSHARHPSRPTIPISRMTVRACGVTKKQPVSGHLYFQLDRFSVVDFRFPPAALIEHSKSRVNRQTGQTVTVWNSRS